ncbi:lysylphosphatidylglycerol synthase domain-containing protein [Micromonospora sp. NPDC048898]|uniref:lysylphosphatidylglycerol synthase domain-containing protein n=1 Tax=Micromonospora sp. NPDC048898 TaxID=3364260 RepID=UPI00371D5C98
MTPSYARVPPPVEAARPARRPGSWRRVLGRVLVTALVVAMLVGAVVALRDQDWSLVGTLAQGHSAGWFALLLAASFLVTSVGLVLGLLSWRALLVDIGGPVGGWASARIFFVAFLSKFIPGKLWALPAIIQMGRMERVPPVRMAAVFLFSTIIVNLSGLTVGAAAGPAVLGGRAWWLVLAAVPVLAFLLFPGLINQAAGTVARLLRRPSSMRVTDRGMRRAIGAQTVSWMVSGHHVWLLAVAAGAPPGRSYLICVAAFSLATVSGVLVVIVPDGVGVREAVLVLALATVLPLPVAGVVALASRLICTLSEIIVGGGWLLAAHLAVRRRAAHAAVGPFTGAESDRVGETDRFRESDPIPPARLGGTTAH